MNVVKLTIKTGEVPTYFDRYNQVEIAYDFRDFDRETLN